MKRLALPLLLVCLLLTGCGQRGSEKRFLAFSDALAAKLDSARVELVGDLDAAFDWIAAHRGEYAAFATAGARDPGLPQLAKRIASL